MNAQVEYISFDDEEPAPVQESEILQGSDAWREMILNRLTIDTVNGKCFWKDATKHHANLVGKEAGSIRKGKKNYWVIKINGIGVKRSQLIFFIANGYWSVDQVFHINRNSLDDRAENLINVKHHKTRNRSAINVDEKYGLLTVISEHGKAKDNHLMWLCKCDCGNETTVISSVLKRRKYASCGCMTSTLMSQAITKHGYHGTKEYKAWAAIKGRCLNPKNKDFYRYGGKGITVYYEWINSFDKFIEHIGDCPDTKFSVDRIDNTKGYEPGNVRWASGSVQALNKSNSYTWSIKGVQFKTLKEAALYFNVRPTTIHRWVKGYLDKRRNSFTPKREDCFGNRIY